MIPVPPFLDAVLKVVPAARWHFTHRLSALPDPCDADVLAAEVFSILEPLHWRDEGLYRISKVIKDLQGSGVIPGGDGAKPEPGNGIPEPGEWRPRCAWCGEPCRTALAKFCCQAHRQAAYERRKRDRRAGVVS